LSSAQSTFPTLTSTPLFAFDAVHDAHCHPTTGTGEPGAIDVLRSVEIGSIVAMSTTVQDQQEVEDLAESDRARVVPAFGA
jgi:Tat protein secretion system quality control protein TatD with DNase activity